jgi:peptidoglycan/xylan/chitin deacetylase (PgdA/CDA1 family)
MLLTLLYHKIGKGKYATQFNVMKRHLSYLHDNYNIVLPGEKLSKGINVCITFDDAYFDFYHYVYPILNEKRIKALLAVTTNYVLEDSVATTLSPGARLSQNSDTNIVNHYCSWKELKHMRQSESIAIASHSVSHNNLICCTDNWEKEIITSKNIINQKVGCEASTFIYPFGRFNKALHNYVKKHYKYIMRIGSAVNFSWHNFNNIIYRIPADGIISLPRLFRHKQLLSYYSKYFINSIRKR